MSFNKRRTFAIISHPDAGKTTITEKLLLFGGAINLAGTVKSRKSDKHATSDWMELEKQRGISITTAVMQFEYKGAIINLLDTPGHEDFSEDTYRTLTAVDCALMVIDSVKGVEPRTIKLMQICRMRNTPIITFINKLDRIGKEPLELLDEIERVLGIAAVPKNWPLGSGKWFKGVYDLDSEQINIYQPGKSSVVQQVTTIESLDKCFKDGIIDDDLLAKVYGELELLNGAGAEFDHKQYLSGKQTPVFFGSAISNFGVQELLDAFVEIAPTPKPRETITRIVEPVEEKFTGFIFKIQANMDPNHRDRIAFMRICSGKYIKGMKMYHVRNNKEVVINNALTFMAADREHVMEAWAGDIIGIHNHGTIQIGDTFTQGENLKFIGVPYFAPEIFKSVRTKDPLKAKALLKGLTELAEEGATQIFKPIHDNRLILGAVGDLQFDVVMHRLQFEYKVNCVFEQINLSTIRYLSSNDPKALVKIRDQYPNNIAEDGGGHLVYMAPTMVNLNLAIDKNPDVKFMDSREH